MSNRSHYFIAIPLPMSLKSFLSNIQDDLKRLLPYKIWPHMDDLHITVKFLGPVDKIILESLCNYLSQLTSVAPFYCKISGIGYFGKTDQPRVIWAGVDKSNKKLFELQKTVESYARLSGFAKENRPYHPHITLAKKWNGNSSKIDILKDLQEKYTNKPNQEIYIDQINIYQINPSQTPKYEIVHKFRLNGDGQ